MLELFFRDFLGLFQENPLGQTFGLAASFVLLLGFFQIDDRKSKIIILGAILFWFLHFWTMGLQIPMVISIIAFAKVALSMKFEKNLYICIGIIILSLLFGIYTFEGITQVLPVVTSIFGTINFFFFHGIIFRMVHMFNSFLRLIYSFIFGSIGGAISHSLTIFILTIAIIRIVSYTGYFHKYKLRLDHVIHRGGYLDTSELAVHNNGHHILRKNGYMSYIFGRIKFNKTS